MSNPGLGVLSCLPPEIIQSILFALIAQRPLVPPSALVPLFTTSRVLHAIATSPALLARVFRFKFDVGAVTRRHFQPTHVDLKEQLVHSCTLLRKLRSGDVHDAEADQTLFSALVLLLENDGKNYAQLESAGVREFAEEFMKRRMWDNSREMNDGWPLENMGNASALWVLWLTLTKEKLETETLREREEFILFVLPYILLTFRYAASQAPPNHFHIPLDSDPLCFPIPSESPNPPRYPIYPSNESILQPHFRARIALRPPLASIAAKLLYVSRREVRKIGVPPHLPLVRGPDTIGPTQADYHQLNKGKAAPLPRGARWDWTTGCAWGINFPDEGDETAAERVDPPGLRIAVGDEESRRSDTTWWRMRLCGDLRRSKPLFVPGDVYKPGAMKGEFKGRIYVPTGETYNHLLYTPQYPSAADERGFFSEAAVYVLMQPFHVELQEHHRICGCAPPSSASSSSSTSTTTTKAPCGVIPTPPLVMQEFTTLRSTQRQPLVVEERDMEAEAARASAAAATSQAETTAAQAGEMVRPDETPARNVDWNDPHAGNLARDRRDQGDRDPASLESNDQEVPEDEQQEHGDEDQHRQHLRQLLSAHIQRPVTLPEIQTVRIPVDHSMRNAWFPGRMGGVTYIPRKVREGFVEREERMRGSWDRPAGSMADLEREHEHEHDRDDAERDVQMQARGEYERGRIRRREEMVFSISGLVPNMDIDASSSSSPTTPSQTHETSSSFSSSSSSQAQPQPQSSWVYETFDPHRISAHDLHLHQHGLSPSSASSSSSFPSNIKPSATFNPSCAYCVALNDARLAEKRKDEGEARKKLDRVLRVFGTPMEVDVDADADGIGDADADVEMEDLDMSGFGLVDDDDGDDGDDYDFNDEQEEEEDVEVDGNGEGGREGQGQGQGRISVLGDDRPNGEPGFWTFADRLRTPSPERRSVGASSSASSSRSTSNPGSQSTSTTSTPTPTPTPTPTTPKRKRAYVSSTRREFDRSRITSASPCSGVQDILLSGQTPPQHAVWYSGGTGYTFYGRVRPWDGLIGIMRVGAVGRRVGLGLGMGMDGDGGGQEPVLLDTTFIFGYLVGETTFVGEWRVGGADPLKPAWSGPVVLSRR
ncbi:hypothetical protein M413DRAFT_30278 [Hebeloma cylindrosporum]|uniref:F-box domain-containing protein n=1 Tax=Hebeloma cylindrosporum TaxID=76867 RepID=A0A0C3C1P7_HEBCY|nr:hypothetical protein M413DRAFT_30278 [Hebeloma cylindrosporum h7]